MAGLLMNAGWGRQQTDYEAENGSGPVSSSRNYSILRRRCGPSYAMDASVRVYVASYELRVTRQQVEQTHGCLGLMRSGRVDCSFLLEEKLKMLAKLDLLTVEVSREVLRDGDSPTPPEASMLIYDGNGCRFRASVRFVSARPEVDTADVVLALGRPVRSLGASVYHPLGRMFPFISWACLSSPSSSPYTESPQLSLSLGFTYGCLGAS